MIKYRLGCDGGHEFESWFRSSSDFDRQARRQLVACPYCHSTAVDRLPMAPAVVSGARKQEVSRAEAATLTSPEIRQAWSELRALRQQILDASEDVGSRFAEEARSMHHGESEERAIHGQASLDEARALSDEGIAIGLIPVLPDDHN